jgi:hypothetical protein
MAVKVMVAPVIASGELGKPARKSRAPGEAPKAKRRRSSVYDADGNEVFITLVCLKCHKMRPLVQFGLRRMADGAIRNQPWCRTCRSASGAEKPQKRMGAAENAESPAAAESVTVAELPASEPPRRTGSIAAEVAAALAGGRR